MRAFECRLNEPAEIVSRDWEFPNSFHGVWYAERTVVRLSQLDYSQVVDQAIASGRFTHREFSDRVVYDRDLIKWRISWSSDAKNRTVSYSYSEQ